jgi:hypothetical protein
MPTGLAEENMRLAGWVGNELEADDRARAIPK